MADIKTTVTVSKDMEDRKLRVIIVGGSIAGLALAHCLHRANIDHIVLEKRAEVSPQEGASIGLWPNGGRILDQLGLYEEIVREGQIEREPLSRIHVAYPDGYVFSHDLPKIIHERFGYGILFTERHKILETLYWQYPDKSNILLNNVVVKIQHLVDGVSVVTADGTSYQGSIVVGADGVHSRVRLEMWKLAESLSPGLVTLKKKKHMTADYACVFGISSSIPGLQSGENINMYRSGFTILTFHNKERIYWFIISKMDKTYTYPSIPRFSPRDAEELCARFAHVRISGDVFGRDIWESRKVASMTAMEEGVFDTWSHGRIVLLGDAVRKMTVITGQGANCAIEDAAVLATLLDRSTKMGGNKRYPNNHNIAAILDEFRMIRHARSKTVYERSRFGVRVQTCDGLAERLIGRYIMPHRKDHLAETSSTLMAEGPLVGFLPLPKRSVTGWERYSRTRQRRSGWVLVVWMFLLARHNRSSIIVEGQ